MHPFSNARPSSTCKESHGTNQVRKVSAGGLQIESEMHMGVLETLLGIIARHRGNSACHHPVPRAAATS